MNISIRAIDRPCQPGGDRPGLDLIPLLQLAEDIRWGHHLFILICGFERRRNADLLLLVRLSLLAVYRYFANFRRSSTIVIRLKTYLQQTFLS